MNRPAAHADTEPSVPVWTAAAVARRLQVSPATLRSWCARYGVGPPGHRAGRYRRYSSTDVAELDTMRRLHRQGVPMTTAAAIARDRHRGPEHPHTTHTSATADASGSAGDLEATGTTGPGRAADATDVSPDELGALTRAARRLDGDAAVATLQTSFAHHGVVATWNQLCHPALARTTFTTDTLTDTGPHSDPTAVVDAECVLVWAVTTSLRRLPTPPPAPPDAAQVLLACADGELHTLALDALHAALDEHHLPARTLGPSVPTPALRHATDHLRPAAVFVWAQTPATAHPDTLEDLRPLARTVVAAGPGWTGDTLPTGVHTTHSLDHALGHARHATAPVSER